MTWASVKDKLPKESKDYLVFNPRSKYSKVYVATWYVNKWSNSNGYITHWMPLPNTPEVKI